MFNQSERETILMAARFCEAVYFPFDELPFSTFRSMLNRPIETWKSENAEGMGVVVDDHLYIVFRGTEPKILKDWMSDFKAAGLPFDKFQKDATAHYGFWTYENRLHRQIKRFIDRNPGKGIIITGHSLGGAAAFICAARLWMAGIRPRVYTFGAPPAGNDEFRKKYDHVLAGSTWRFEFAGDIVPRLPALAPWLEHVSRRLYLPFFGKKIQVDPPKISRWADIAGRRIVAIASLRFFSGARDHGLFFYRKRLAKLFSKAK
jgi:pimeloyl-ACP methyl ester carboxylesterase